MRLPGCLVGLAMMGSAAFATEQQQAPSAVYAVKPSDVIVPDGEKLGDFRRVIQPFKNWTLICDESLKSKRRVCNFTQSIINQKGAIVFNWSLVATAGGKPLMMMRVPAAVGMGQPIRLALGKKPDWIVAQTDRCDASLCFAVIAIGDVLKRHIRTGTDCAISYQISQSETIAFDAPLDGLYAALAGLK
jgi:invasion protein IalB